MRNSQELGIGTWLSIGSPIVTELIANFPFQWLLFDLEHGCMTETNLLANIQAAGRKNTECIVRLGDFRSALAARVLDWGASGIMVPHVTSARQARGCLQDMLYPPLGNRGYSSSARVYRYGLESPKDIHKIPAPYFLAQIENEEGVKNAEEIAAVEGVDVLFVGPSDLKLDLTSRPAGTTYEFQEAISLVAQAARKYNKQCGILVRNMEDIPHLRQLGFTCLAIGSDIGILRSGYTDLLAQTGESH